MLYKHIPTTIEQAKIKREQWIEFPNNNNIIICDACHPKPCNFFKLNPELLSCFGIYGDSKVYVDDDNSTISIIRNDIIFAEISIYLCSINHYFIENGRESISGKYCIALIDQLRRAKDTRDIHFLNTHGIYFK